jgi:hypothetical protein
MIMVFLESTYAARLGRWDVAGLRLSRGAPFRETH